MIYFISALATLTLIRVMIFGLGPSKVIGEDYLSRWHIIPRNRFFNIYLHRFTGSDDDRALHCHPWASVSIKLRGVLFEHYDQEVMLPEEVDGIMRLQSYSVRRCHLSNLIHQ